MLAIIGVLTVVGPRITRRSEIGEVVRGRFAAMATTALRPAPELLDGVSTFRASMDLGADDPRASARGSASHRRATAGRSALGDAVVPGAIAAGVGAAEWLTPNQSVLDAMQALTHDQVSNSLDLWSGVHDNGYHLWSASSLIKWRGHVGEQQVMEQLSPWLGDRIQLEPLSNNPGSDLSIDGRDFNVKVTEDFQNVGPSHFAENPDIPIILNSDAANIPQDALHVDLSEPFDVAMLDGHHVIVAEGFTLSGAEDALTDAFGPVVGGIHDAGDLGDAASAAVHDAAFPVLGSAIRVVRSGIREGALLKHHGDTGRLVKNVGTDVAVTGGGVAVGATIGHIVGGGIDVLSGGMTLGAGTWLGGIAGSALGGFLGSQASRSLRMVPLKDARADVGIKLEAYSSKITEVEDRTNRTWHEDVLPTAQRRAEVATASLRGTAQASMSAASTDLHAAATLDRGSRKALLDRARKRVDATSAQEDSALARRRARAWSLAADTAWETADVFDVVLASPGGERVTREWLEDAAARQELVLAAAAETARLIGEAAIRTRATLASSLADTRAELFAEGKRQLDKPLRDLEQANAKVRHELVATGLVKPEDVVVDN
ncbi:hypothetical protein [Geodermatophilus telluris]|uniref:hypothetical protein n=1 Tax=Geodermatophilus telluris TaxID=1190417 RepID=UPI001113E25C|nr:hypothetical protein [Geodermatophilus telluris]